MDAAVVTVGDELLAGRTTNTNARWLCERLAERGVSVERVTTVPDRVDDIAGVIDDYRAAYDAVVITGGLGPTHDDVTMAGVAAAVGRPLETHDEALAWLTGEAGYSGADLVEGTADLPGGARPLPNEVGVAPGAVVDGVYVLPGVPEEMRAMFEAVADAFRGETRHRRVVLADEPESELLDRIAGLRERFDVTVGSYPGESVRVSIEGADEAVVDEAAAWLGERVREPDHR